MMKKNVIMVLMASLCLCTMVGCGSNSASQAKEVEEKVEEKTGPATGT